MRTYRNIRDIIVKMYRKYQKRNYDIDTSWRRYLLPIQTAECRVLSDCASMVCGYCMDDNNFAVTDSKTGIPVTGEELTMYKIAVFVLLFE